MRGANLALGLVCFLVGCGAPRSPGAARTDPYLYEDTRRLVRFVEEAAGEVEARGTAAFADFSRSEARRSRGELYLFVYDGDGVAVFHGAKPELVGKNLSGFRDLLGKPMVREVADFARREGKDAAGWVFYLWEEQSEFLPRWKASYVRKAVAPDGRAYAVGSGSSRLKIEKAWVKDRVDLAVDVLRRKGKAAAFTDFRDPASPFQFLETYLFVTDQKGRALVDPSYPTRSGRDLGSFRDAVGRLVLGDVTAKLEKSDQAWSQYLWPRPGDTLPSRKALYVRKVVVEGETLYVGSDFFLASPVWMRH
jgi:signal transduction histidine kinase